MQEIERKFLINSNSFKSEARSKERIIQGYLNRHSERTIRVRIKGEKGFVTIKGKSNETGTTRFEWEKEISLTEAKSLLKLCEKGFVDKIRYEVMIESHIFEIDEFLEENEGLLLAEVELSHPQESFVRPHWLGKEVTGNLKYYNSQLSKNPFKKW